MYLDDYDQKYDRKIIDDTIQPSYTSNKRKVNIQYMINEVISKVALLLPQVIY